MNFFNIYRKIKNKLKHAFPAVDYLSLNPVGLDITNNAVRIVKLSLSENGYIPKFYKEIIFNKNINFADMNEVSEDDIESLVQVLKKIRNEFNLKYVVVSLPEEKNYIYRTILSTEAIEDIPSAIRFSMEENVPLSVKDVNFDYEIIKINNRGIDTVVSVFPKDVIKFYTEIIKKAGLTPLSFQSESVALSNAVIEYNDKSLYLLVRFLDDRVNVAISEAGAVQYTSTIKLSTKKIFDDLESDEVRKMVQELNKILIYWFTSRRYSEESHKIEKAIIVGKNVINEGFEEFLEGKLKLDVILANVWTNCFDSQKYVSELNKENAFEYSVAIGLALKTVKYK